MVFTWYGYGTGEDAPGLRDPAVSPFKAAHTMIQAHTRVYRMYDKEFKHTQKGASIVTIIMFHFNLLHIPVLICIDSPFTSLQEIHDYVY